MRSRSIAIITALVMALTIVGFVPKEVSAAENEFASLKNVWMNNDVREKIGEYYIWLDDGDNYNNRNYDKLQCAKRFGVIPKTLATLESGDMSEWYVSDGYTIYYAQTFDYDYDYGWEAEIYETNVDGTYNKSVAYLYSYVGLTGFYDGKLYYSTIDCETPVLMSFDLSSGYTEEVLYGYDGVEAYGSKFIVNKRVTDAPYFDGGVEYYESETYLYDVESGELTLLPSKCRFLGAYNINVDGLYCVEPDRNIKGVYYTKGSNYVIKKYNPADGTSTQITKLLSDNYVLQLVGHEYAVFEKKTNNNGSTYGPLYKVDYSTGKLTRYMVSLPKPSATAASSDYTAVKVSWKSVANAQKYEVYRSTSKSGTYSLLTTTTNLNYIDRELTTGKTYYYKVRALREDVVGKFSDIKSAKPTYRKPLNVKAKAALKSATITWSKVNGAEGYQVYRAVKKTGKYTKVKTVKGTKFKNTGLKKNKKYYYKVRAYGTVNGSVKYGNFSKIVYCTTGRK